MSREPLAPHCDAAILHAPGECSYCDMYPEWQELRRLWGVAFTGHHPQGWEVACPSDQRRPGGVNQIWPGNKPTR